MNQSNVNINFAAIAAHLPGLWVVVPRWNIDTQAIDPTCAKLKRDDGLVLSVHAGGYHGAGKVNISLSRPTGKNNARVDVWEGSNHLSDPSINASDTKTPEQIARDIARRLLPDAEKVFLLVNERIAADKAYHDKRAALVTDLCSVVNAELPTQNREIVNLGNDAAHGYGHFRVSSDTVDFELRSIPADKARILLAFIRDNVFNA